MIDFNLVSYLMNVAPVIVVMGVIMIVLWKHHLETIKYIRKVDKENLDTLKNLGFILENVLKNAEIDNSNVITEIKRAVDDLRSYIDNRFLFYNNQPSKKDRKNDGNNA